MRKLIIQVSCLNKEKSLPVSLGALPREVPGFDVVEWLVIDNGSTDRTVDVARALGVDHIVSLRHNQGLARAFMAGIEACLKLGADVIVNTDADNQYDASCIPDLVRPILDGEADVVVGARLRAASDTSVADATSGFRAIHRDAAFKLNVFNQYTYTIETIIQAGRKGMRITSVPIRINGDLRPSRRINSVPVYVRRSLATIYRLIVDKPFRVFASSAFVLFLAASALGARYLWFFISGAGAGHIQSLLFASVLAVASFVSFAIAVIGDLIVINRTLLEDIRTREAAAPRSREGAKPQAPRPPRLL